MLWLLPFVSLLAAADEPEREPIAPMLLLLLFTVAGAVLGLIALAIVTFLVAVLTGAGMVSVAALVGVIRRRWTSGLRVLYYQACAAIGLLGGAILAWAATLVYELRFSPSEALLVGSGAGLCSGVGMAFLLDQLLCIAHRRCFPSPPVRDVSSTHSLLPESKDAPGHKEDTAGAGPES